MFPANDGKFRFVLAPMEGVTDAPMRQLMTDLVKWDWCVTEFLRINDLVPPDKVFFRDVPELENGGRTRAGTPVAVQLLGGNAQMLAQSAKRVVELGAPAVDLNFGCPAPTVNRHDGGATLLKFPHRIFEIVSAVRAAVPTHIPVSAKIRLGWENPQDVVENARQVCAAGADWLTIHARTRVVGYAPPVYWDWIRKASDAVSIPVVANGDIRSIDDISRCREITGCTHYMIGRGAMADPHLVEKAREFFERGSFTDAPLGRQAWAHLFSQLEQATAPHPYKSRIMAGRCKQWGNMANRVRKQEWFEGIKKEPTFEGICQLLLGDAP